MLTDTDGTAADPTLNNPLAIAYAHTLLNQPPEQWEPLQDHLDKVASLSGEFADAFQSAAWGSLVGRWHDLGKYSDAFQHYLQRSNDPDAGEEGGAPGHVDHSTFGAQHAARTLPDPFGQIIAFCIAGHHSGLTDMVASDTIGQQASLTWRLQAGPPRVPAVVLPPDFPTPAKPEFPFAADRQDPGLQVSLFVRMLFSCLIDADRTATEEFCNLPVARLRKRDKPTVERLRQRLDAFLDARRFALTRVNQIRSKILADCRAAAGRRRGFFKLNVPTGGGKTLSSLSFALNHAVTHGLRRVVVAIPFTSIIEQTADVYRDALGDLAPLGLVEHHSNITPTKQTLENKLAAENWDAPLIVTTNVQLYESLYASATTPCRKLHRLANSVIILDEAQTIPIELLTPTLAALKRLVADYGCTIVLCTATQPALERNEEFKIGIDPDQVEAIIPSERNLHDGLQRVMVKHLGRLSEAELADRIAGEPSGLCVVNTRPQASKLFAAVSQRVGEEGCFHLSTLMCAEHRREVLAEVRRRLADGRPCRLISTQLIEAGVDVDFPCVYREVAGFDSIAQAAGRCNREGKLAAGRVYVFETDQLPPPGLLRRAAEVARELASAHLDPLSPDAVQAFFRQLYWRSTHIWDKSDVLACLNWAPRTQKSLPFLFRTAANRYRLIEDNQTQVLVPFNDEARELKRQLESNQGASFDTLRRAQRYSVGVHDPALRKLADDQVILSDPSGSGLWLLVNKDAYSKKVGLSLGKAGADPEWLVP